VFAHAETYVRVMATNMTVAVAARMRFRGHGWAAVSEMVVAMYLPFLVLFPPLWLGVLSATGLMVVGHLLMLFAIAAAMVRRRHEYA
jgi:flagellar biosynthetic protein FliP